MSKPLYHLLLPYPSLLRLSPRLLLFIRVEGVTQTDFFPRSFHLRSTPSVHQLQTTKSLFPYCPTNTRLPLRRHLSPFNYYVPDLPVDDLVTGTPLFSSTLDYVYISLTYPSTESQCHPSVPIHSHTNISPPVYISTREYVSKVVPLFTFVLIDSNSCLPQKVPDLRLGHTRFPPSCKVNQ